MNKVIFIVISLLIFHSSNAKDRRFVNDIAINDYYEGNIQLDNVVPNTYWTLIVLNSNLGISNKFLDKLANRKLDLSSTVVLLIGSHESKDITQNYYRKYQKKLQPHSWINNTSLDILKKLEISGTPVILGMHDNSINWQISGMSITNFNKIVKHIEKWAGKKEDQ